MTSFRRSLRMAVGAEGRAYGFTLTIWGTGALGLHELGPPVPSEAFSYIGGAIVGMSLVLFLAFGDIRKRFDPTEPPTRAFGVVHIISVLCALFAGWFCLRTFDGPVAWFAGSLAAVFIHQLFLALETMAASSTTEEEG